MTQVLVHKEVRQKSQFINFMKSKKSVSQSTINGDDKLS